MPNAIDPRLVKWKFFSLDGEKKIVASDSLPSGKKPVALINSSTFFVPQKAKTPEVIKARIEKALEYEGCAGLCFAIPCEDIAVMKKYYGAENVADVEDDYISLRMHNDLREGNPSFAPHQARFEGTMPAKEGAKQIASAIENGFDIWSYNSGGNSIAPKLELCEEYFRENFDRLRAEEKLQRKVKFVGFSNGTMAAFHLRGLVDYVLGYGLAYSFRRMEEFQDDVGDESLQSQTDSLLRSFKGEDVKVVRKFGSAVLGTFEEVKAKYEEALKDKSPIANVAVWLGQMVPATMGKLPNFGSDEKVILEVEYSMHQAPKGYEADIALRRFLKSDAINPKNILCIVLGDFIDHTEENIPRKHGLIPDFKNLSAAEQTKIKEIAESQKLSAEEYIKKSNQRSKELMEQVKRVAAEHNIPVIEGGERRVSHGKYSKTAPSHVKSLEFNEADSSITQKCVLRANAPVREDLILAPRKMATHCDPINPDIAAVGAKIDEAKIMPLTSSAASFKFSDAEEIIAGMPVDLATIDPKHIAGKGVVVYLPMVKGSISSSEQFNAFQLSRNYQDAKFIALLMRIPAEYGADETMIEDRNSNYLKLINDLAGDKKAPSVFISTTSVESEYFLPFSHVINLEKMLSEKPKSFVGRVAAGKLASPALASSHGI